MAALTWRDVAAPQFAGVNQAYQNTGATLDRAFSGLSEGLKQFATERQDGVDNSILARSLAIQDPNQMREALATGKLLEGVDLTKVSPKVLEALSTRRGTLLNQASTEQGIASSKTSQAATQQNIDFSAQDQTRKLGQQAIQDAARPQLARQFGITGPAAEMSPDELQKLAQTTSGLATAALGRDGQRISNATGSFNLAKGRRDDAVGQGALNRAADLLSRYGTTDGLRSGIEESQFSNPAEKLATIAYLEKTTGQPIYTPLDAQTTGGGSGRSGTGGKPSGAGGKDGAQPYTFQDDRARLVKQEIDRSVAQKNAVGVTADVVRTMNDFRPPLEIVNELVPKIPGAMQGKIVGVINTALKDNPNMLPSEIASALERTVRDSSWYTRGSTTLGDDVGIDMDSFNANLKKMASGKADYLSADTQQTLAAGRALESADESLAKAKSDLIALQQRSASQGGKINTSEAESRVVRLQQKLDDLVQTHKDTLSQQPIRTPEAPVSDANARGLEQLYNAGRTKRGGN